jgi:hypothetical protein
VFSANYSDAGGNPQNEPDCFIEPTFTVSSYVDRLISVNADKLLAAGILPFLTLLIIRYFNSINIGWMTERPTDL